MAARRGSSTHKTARLRRLQFEGVSVRPRGAIADAKEAASVARRIFRDEKLDWEVRTLGKRATSVLLTPKAGARVPSVALAWQLAYRLRTRSDVERAEPAFVMPGEGPYRPLQRKSAVGGDSHKACSNPAHWALDLCNVRAAWALAPAAGGASRGADVVIAHPDTGILIHDELIGADVRLAQGYDFVDDDPDPSDPLLQPDPGHGTSTASVLLSPEGDEAKLLHVCGVAPLATLVPMRISTSVVHFSWTRLTAAIHLALEQGAHVISMSLGGPLPSFALEEALEQARDEGVIAVAAAGNYWPFVVYPARYEQTVGCAACNCVPAPWAWSAGGGDVDISAPGESVWRATATPSDLSDVHRGNGTSYATVHVAGVAALWLAHHGRANLVAKYGVAGVPAAFQQLLAAVTHANTPANWDHSNFGAGIIDAVAMLAAPLPAKAHAAAMATRRRAMRAAPSDVERIAEYFPRADPDRVRTWLAKQFGTTKRAVPVLLATLGDEVAFHVTSNPEIYKEIHAAVAGRHGAVAPSNRRVFQRASPTLKARLA